MNLFNEIENYDSYLIGRTLDKRACYIICMLLQDGALFDYYAEYSYKENKFVPDIDAALDCNESNFLIDNFERLLMIFPNAKNILNKRKFCSE